MPAISPPKASHGPPRRPVSAPILVIAGLAIAVCGVEGVLGAAATRSLTAPNRLFSLLKRGLSFGERTLGCF
jgi:hypothetical protein